MPHIIKSIQFNFLINFLGLIYYNFYLNKSYFIYLYTFFYHSLLLFGLYYNSKNNIRISNKNIYFLPSNIYFLFNILLVVIIESLSIYYCNKIESKNITYEIITSIPKIFIFELIFDFFHYFLHRLSHYKYFYYFHKIHHSHTHNMTVFSSYNHDFFDLIISNFIPMYLTSFIITLYDTQFFIFLISKTLMEISGHSGVYIKGSSFIQFIWIPKLFNIELYTYDHYIHHTKFNYNFSKRFILWDKVFGTFYKNNENNENNLIIKNNYIRNILFILFLTICYNL